MRIVVTGGSGRLGTYTVRSLLEAGHEVLSLDRVPPAEELCDSWVSDLSQIGDLYQAFKGSDAVVHLAAWQSPGLTTDSATYSNNVTVSYNVLKAATDMDVGRVVMASSIAAYGFTYAVKFWQPDYLPLDEDHPCAPQDPYGLSKITGERLADSFVSYTGTSVISLRISGVNFDLTYQSLLDRWANPGAKIGTFWSYIDARDAGKACRLAAETNFKGHKICNLSNDISRYREPTAELIQKFLPGTKIREGFSSHFGGLDNTRIKNLLGFEAQFDWRDHITAEGKPIS